jgi:hypothetical protein
MTTKRTGNTSLTSSGGMADLFDDYESGAAWDEMFEAPDVPRAPYRALHEALQPLSSRDLDERAAARWSRSADDSGCNASCSARYGGRGTPGASNISSQAALTS